MDDTPLEGARIGTGFGAFASPIRPVIGGWNRHGILNRTDLTASLQGYVDSTLLGINPEQEDTLELNFILMHPQLNISTDQIDENIRARYGGAYSLIYQ